MKPIRIALLTLIFALLVCAQPPQQPPAQPPVSIGNLNLNGASLTQVIDQFARLLRINIIPDPKVAGTVTINTYGETRNLDAMNVLQLILKINDFALVQDGDIYRVVPLSEATRHLPLQQNAQNIPEDDQVMLNMIFLKYVTVDELATILQRFTGDNAKIISYAPTNLLFILDSRRNMRRTMELVSLFDSETFANERVRLYELQNARPSDLIKELEGILKSVSLDNKTSTVRFLPVDRISTLIAVAPNPGVFDTVEQWIKKLDIPPVVTNNASDYYVYRVRYGRSDCLAIALNSLFGTIAGGGAGYGGGYGGYGGGAGFSPFGAYAPPYAGGYGGGYGGGGFGGAGAGYGAGYGGAYGGYGGYGGGSYGAPNSFGGGFGGTGACGAGGLGGGGYGGGYGVPAFGGYSAQVPITGTAAGPGVAGAGQAPAGGAAGAAGAAGQGASQEATPRIVPNPLDNSLLIFADAQRYQSILKLLKDLDVPPRQILLEAKIYSIDLVDQFASGVSAYLRAKTGQERRPLATLVNGLGQFSAGTLVGQSRELLMYLSLQENSSHAHIISEPSLIATDSIPASINVGTQVPVATSSTTIPAGGNVAVSQSVSGVSTGVTLQVNARVNPSGVVTLIINQEVSKPTQSAGNSLTPSFDQQVVQTQITTQDGDTIAIGGVISESTGSATSGVPLLSKIPFVGGVFGSHTYSHERTELILFMTPHVIYDTTDLLEASDQLKTQIKKLRKYIKE